MPVGDASFHPGSRGLLHFNNLWTVTGGDNLNDEMFHSNAVKLL